MMGVLLALAPEASCGDVWPTGRRRATSWGLRHEALGGDSGGDASGLTASAGATLRDRVVQVGAFAAVMREGENPQVYASGAAAG